MLALLSLLSPAALGEGVAEGRPFMLWTRVEGEAIRNRVEAEPWARAEWQRVREWRGHGTVVNNLFKYVVMNDRAAGEAERDYLLTFINARVDQRTWSDDYLSALRYDAVYDLLTDEQRNGVEQTFRAHVKWYLENDKRTYAKTNWLPNMHWPRTLGICMMAVALRDEQLVRDVFNANGGIKYFFDDYVSDGYFYNEEFGKHYATIGELLLWCRGVERLGLDELGFGYVGKNGATARKYLEGIHLVGYPRVDLGTTRAHYPKMTMGDARGGRGMPGYAFQHSIVTGYFADGSGGNPRFMAANMNGRDHKDRLVEKLMTPLWFEIAHRKWPDAGFDYFLAQMRSPAEDKYYPSLYFGVEPIDPAQAKAPPAPSGVYPERGIVMLRAAHSSAYWESPAPAVGMRLATPYAHGVPDCFALTGFYAFNRPIYLNRQISSNYAGTDPSWSNSIRSHSAVIVDNLEPIAIGQVPTRQSFDSLVKFVAARARGIYPDVDQTRALFLTNEYLLDVSRLVSTHPRNHAWQVHTLGHLCPDNPRDFTPTRYLVGSLQDLREERSFVANERPWSVTAVQTSAGADSDAGRLGESWFDTRVGVRVTMLGEPGQIAFTAVSPTTVGVKDRLNFGADEPGGATIAASRNAPSATFVALHEPFKPKPLIHEFRRVQQTDEGIAVTVVGHGVNDRILFRYGNDHEQIIVLSGGGETFTFADRGYVRVGKDHVDACGDVRSLTIKVEGEPKFFLNGKETPASVEQGYLNYGPPVLVNREPPRAPAPLPEGPIATRWMPDHLRLPTGGTGAAKLKVRNNGFVPLTVQFSLSTEEGLTLRPSSITLNDFQPGEEQEVMIEVEGGKASRNQLRYVNITAGEGSAISIQNTRLPVMHGVVREDTQHWPGDFAATVHAPRYVMKYYYTSSAAAGLVLDAKGMRRFGTAREVYPTLWTATADAAGKTAWTNIRPAGYAYFSPKPVEHPAEPTVLHESGQHPHGARSPFEYRFTEDWVWVRAIDAPAEEIAHDWGGGEDAYPSTKTLVALENEIRPLDVKRETPDVVALLSVTPQFPHGRATFYPPGARWRSGRVLQPAGRPMAFTFCTEAEFPALVEKWKKERLRDVPG